MNRAHKRLMLGSMIVAHLVVTCPLTLAGVEQQVDLNTWTAESYAAVSGFSPGVWTIAGDGLSVYQSVNGQPTLFYSDFNAFNVSFKGKVAVEVAADDDFFGFALGFQPGDAANAGADYLLIDWKMANQGFDFGAPSCTPGSTAPAGLAVSRVEGIPTADEFWGHTNFDTPACSDANNGLTELQRGASLGNTGWANFVEYEFQFDFTTTSLKVFVDGVLQLDIAGSFADGRIAFYNFSQSCVRYSGLTVSPLGACCDTPASSCNNGVLEADCLAVGQQWFEDTVCSDLDGDADGVPACAGDCNDMDDTVFPGADELCNGVDDNCDGNIDEADETGNTDDCNDNGIADGCELAGNDCNSNGILDECDISGAAGGAVFLTGHDADFHAVGTVGPRNINIAAIAFVMDPVLNTFVAGGIDKFLFVQSNIAVPGSHRDGKVGIVNSGFTEGSDFEQHNASTLDGELDQLGTKYSAIVVASDFGGILTQAELDILNARSLDIITFLNDGGGLYAMAESNGQAQLTPNGGHFGFLPFVVSSSQLDQSEVGVTVTAFGASLGLTDADVSAAVSHNIFTASAGLQVVDNDAAGNILSLAGRGVIDPNVGIIGDCNSNGVPDDCEDCNTNGAADECDLDDGTSGDCNSNSIPDECEEDCNANGVADECELADGTSTDCNSNGTLDECEAEPVACAALDIKPGSCPNSFNRNSHGVLPVGLLGTDTFDVSTVDLSTVQISRADGVGGSVGPNEGPPGPHSVFSDVGTPFDGELCNCHELTGDGVTDLSLKFKTDELVPALELDGESPGALVELTVSGNLLDGTPFSASDCVRLVPPGTPPGQLFVESGDLNRWIYAGPLDLQLDAGGFDAFDRTYPLSTEVTITAPPSVTAEVFFHWVIDGIRQTSGLRTITLVITQEQHQANAIYRLPSLGDVRPKRQGTGIGIQP